MAMINISVPDDMKLWVEAKVERERYDDVSDVVRNLIERERLKDQKIAALQVLIDEGRASGISPRSVEEIFADARRRAGVSDDA